FVTLHRDRALGTVHNSQRNFLMFNRQSENT
ncbi:MAG: hypothetical protein ACJAZA_002171, partial [Shewanella psychromarinicola]